jgi:DNA-binding MarR family transcriptional regulator
MVLERERGTNQGILHITGRDIEEQSYAMEFKDGLWVVIGEAQFVYVSQARKDILEALASANKPLGPSEIAEITGKTKGSLPKLLRPMVQDGLIKRHDGGKYSVIERTPRKFESKEEKAP